MALTPEQRTQRSVIANYTRWSRVTDTTAATAAAREAFLAKFEDEVDPLRELPEGERARKAEYARKAYFARLGFASSKSRGKSKAKTEV